MYIDESFLSFLWQFTYFNTSGLKTIASEDILIIDPGRLNTHAGPDFSGAKIKINHIQWVGSVELHVKSSDWDSHDHSSNPDYDRVILHVVWKHDADVRRNDNSRIPVIEIGDRVSHSVLERYSRLIYGQSMYPCHSDPFRVKPVSVISEIERSLIDRLEYRNHEVFRIYEDTDKCWEETSYRILFRNFGFKVNQENMYLLSKIMPFQVIVRHLDDPFQLEALLFGTAGLLDKTNDGYSGKLREEYTYLKHKYSLTETFLKRYHWRFLRLRPQNFPTIRLAQLAALLIKVKKIFSFIINYSSIKNVSQILTVTQSKYWEQHYDFGKKYNKKVSGLGIQSIHNILTNSFVPILSAYAKKIDQERYLQKAVDILQSLPPEDNHIIRDWHKVGVKPLNAFESQGLIHLSNSYCCKKKCLNCKIGTEILLNH